jgi:hypothetical protein
MAWLRRFVAGLWTQRPGFNFRAVKVNLLWTKQHWDRLNTKYFSFPPVSLHQNSILDSFITGDISFSNWYHHRSQWPRGLRRMSMATCLLRSWVRIPPGAWMFVCCACCVLSGRGLCDKLITHPEESYRLWYIMCDQETSWTRRP